MKVYLDNCIFQDLKKEELKPLLQMIIKSKGECIYCFSEAHIMDLSKDKTNEKFLDMDFMRNIVDDNCFHYDKEILIDNFTPREYYDRFDWTESIPATNVISNLTTDDMFGGLFKSILEISKNIPLNFNDLISQNQLPDNMPHDMKSIFNVSNMYEWMIALTSYSDTLSADPKAFKEQLQYLHKNPLLEEVYKAIGIEGYNGQQITDKEKFRNSYTNYYLKNTKGKYRYDLFMDMYNGLEIFSLVQGKPKKQKMMNMLNDSRHSFFGAFCDIVVSKDKDFLNKTQFMYNLHEINPQIYTISEFEQYLGKNIHSSNTSFFDLIKEIDNKDTKWNSFGDNVQMVFRVLDNTYFGYFNILIHNSGDFYFTKNDTTFMKGTLIKEIKFCINRLSEELGNDIYLRGKWIDGELKKNEEKEWHGRTWVLDKDIVVDLKFSDKLYIIIHLAKKN